MELFLIVALIITSSGIITKMIIKRDLNDYYSMLDCEKELELHKLQWLIPGYNWILYQSKIPDLEAQKNEYIAHELRDFEENDRSVKRVGADLWKQEEQQFIQVKKEIKTIVIQGNTIKLHIQPNALEKTMLYIPEEQAYQFSYNTKKREMYLTQNLDQIPLYFSCKKDSEYRFLVQAKQFLLQYQNELQKIEVDEMKQNKLSFSFQKKK